MRILVRPDHLNTLATRLGNAAGQLFDFKQRLTGALSSMDVEGAQRANLDGYIQAVQVRTHALADFADDLSRWLAHKAEVFRRVDEAGLGPLSEETIRFITNSPHLPDGLLLEASRREAERLMSAGDILNPPEQKSGWSWSWPSVGDVLVGGLNMVGGALSVAAGVVLIETGIGAPLGIYLVVDGASTFLEGAQGATGIGYVRDGKKEPINFLKEGYKQVATVVGLPDEYGTIAYNIVGLATGIAGGIKLNGAGVSLVDDLVRASTDNLVQFSDDLGRLIKQGAPISKYIWPVTEYAVEKAAGIYDLYDKLQESGEALRDLFNPRPASA